jgi:hypothetical protein
MQKSTTDNSEALALLCCVDVSIYRTQKYQSWQLQKAAADELTDVPALQNGGRGDGKAWR